MAAWRSIAPALRINSPIWRQCCTASLRLSSMNMRLGVRPAFSSEGISRLSCSTIAPGIAWVCRCDASTSAK